MAAFRMAQKQAELDKAAIDARVPRELVSSKEYEERGLALERATLALAGLGLAGAAVLFYGAPHLMRVFAGQGYEQGIPALAALGAAVPFLFVNFALGSGVFAIGKEWWGFAGLCCSLLLNVLGNYWVMTRYPGQALVGAALFTAASEATLTISHVLVLTLARRTNGSRRSSD